MNHSDIEHMAQGFPPSSVGKDHEEVVTFLATSLLAAQQKLNALAAENAALKSLIREVSESSEECEFNGDEHRYVVIPESFDALTDLLEETPATDAALNAIRAEGIIMFASKQLLAAGDLDRTITLERLMLDAEEFVGQMRANIND